MVLFYPENSTLIYYLKLKYVIMKIKLIYLAASIIGIVLSTSCSKDNAAKKSTYTFVDQEMQGKIGGEAWTLNAGKGEVSYFDTTRLSLNFYVEESADPCNEGLSGNMVMCSVPPKVGLYEFSFSFSGEGENQTATLYHLETSMNTIATEGAIEITLIDEENGIIKGRISAEVDDDDFVNGNFIISYCL
jgi:hypothetical protein